MEITREFLTKLSGEVNVLGWDNVLKVYSYKEDKINSSKDKYDTVIYIKQNLELGNKIQIGYDPIKKISNTKISNKTKKSIPKSNSKIKETVQKKSSTKNKSVLASPTKNKKYTYNKKNKFDQKTKNKTTGIKYYIERFLLFCFLVFCTYQIFIFLRYFQSIVHK